MLAAVIGRSLESASWHAGVCADRLASRLEWVAGWLRWGATGMRIAP